MYRKRLALAALAAAVAVGSGAFDTSQSGHSRVAGPVHAVIVDGNAGSVHVEARGEGAAQVTHKSKWLFTKPTVRQSAVTHACSLMPEQPAIR